MKKLLKNFISIVGAALMLAAINASCYAEASASIKAGMKDSLSSGCLNGVASGILDLFSIYGQADSMFRYRFISALVISVLAALLVIIISILLIRQSKQTKQLAIQAERDLLTGVYNRPASIRIVKEYLATHNGSPCTFVMIDLDNLKGINDMNGHRAGDEAIIGISSVLKAQFRRNDVIGRIGEDEFVVFLKGINSREKLIQILTRLQTALNKIRIIDGKKAIRCSIGVYSCNADDFEYEELYRRADISLYQAKNSGKNTFAFYDESKDPHLNGKSVTIESDDDISGNSEDIASD